MVTVMMAVRKSIVTEYFVVVMVVCKPIVTEYFEEPKHALKVNKSQYKQQHKQTDCCGALGTGRLTDCIQQTVM
jgi:hypothetical protein